MKFNLTVLNALLLATMVTIGGLDSLGLMPATFQVGLKGIADRVLPSASASTPKISKRVVSLGGSITETIVALGHKDSLIGIDTTSVYPPNVVQKLPSVGYLRQLSTEGVLSLEPGIIIASEQIGPKTVVEQLKKSGVQIEMFDKDLTPESATKNIRRLGKLFNEPTKAEALISELESKLAEAKKMSGTFKKKPKVLFIYARGSRVLNISGHSTSAHAVIELAGGANAFGEIEGFKPMTSEAVVAAQPDVILMLSRGVGSIGGESKVFDLPGIALTPAGKNRRVLVMDDLKLLGFGPRLGEAILELTTAFAGADKASGQL